MPVHVDIMKGLYDQLNDLQELVLSCKMLLAMGQQYDRQGRSVNDLLTGYQDQMEYIEAKITAKTLEN